MNATRSKSEDFKIHRGEIVRTVVDKMGCEIASLARKIHVTRSTLYRQFEKPDMDWRYITSIGRALHHDFSDEIPELKLRDFDNVVNEPESEYGQSDSLLDRAIKEIDKWKTEAYINLQETNKWREKYYELLAQTLDKQTGGSKGQ